MDESASEYVEQLLTPDPVPMSHRQRGYARAAKLSPERRKEISRKAYLAGAVNAVVSRAPELSAQQIERLRAVLAPVVNG